MAGRRPARLLPRRQVVAGMLACPALLVGRASFAIAEHPTIALFGGGLFPLEWLRRTSRLAGPGRRKVVVAPYSGRDPKKTFAAESAYLSRFGFRRAKMLPLDDMALDMVRDADVVWFSGGSIPRQMQKLSKVPGLFDALRQAHRAGTVMAGGSAGASVMGEATVVELQSRKLATEPGLNLLPNMIIDTHVAERGRERRLRGLVGDNRNFLGLGLDEQTGVIIEGTQMSVYGKGDAVIFFWEERVKTIALRNGDRYDIESRRPMIAL